MSVAIEWMEKTVAVASLTPYERNPRTITKTQFTQLKDSLSKLGQFAPIPVTPDLRMAGGHQRLQAFRELGWDMIRVSVPNRQLTDDEFKRILIQSNHHNGMFDTDELAASFEIDNLVQWGLPETMFTGARAAPDEEKKKKPKLCPHCGKDINEPTEAK